MSQLSINCKVRHGQRGFSLVEMLVYVAMLALVSTSSILLLFSLDDLFAKYQAEQRVLRSATTALERIVHDIRAADSVTTAVYTSPGSLTLTSNGATTVFATSSTALHVTENGVDQGALTDSGVSVTNVRFYAYDNGTSEFARVRLTLEAVVGDTTINRTFTAGAVLRGSYE